MSEIGSNFVPRPYRGVSVQEAPVPLDLVSVRDYLMGRPVYRRTSFMVLVRDGDRAVVQVEKASTEPLFTPVTEVRYLAHAKQMQALELIPQIAAEFKRAVLVPRKNPGKES